MATKDIEDIHTVCPECYAVNIEEDEPCPECGGEVVLDGIAIVDYIAELHSKIRELEEIYVNQN